MFDTRVTGLLGIQYPIIQGGMLWLSGPELTAAVSNAGGLGILSAATFPETERLRAAIRQTRALTANPFGVNIPLLPAVQPIDVAGVIAVMGQEGVAVAETAGRSPEEYIPLFRQNGIKVMHKVTAVRFARKAEKIGCDMVVADGCECAGHPGEEGVTSLVLLPAVVDAVSIPVIAAGGFADGRGLAAALALGAEGILMGTRFMVSLEAPMHSKIKEYLAGLSETETMLVLSSLHNSVRVINNSVAQKLVEMERRGAPLEELIALASGAHGKNLLEQGDVESGLLACGQAVGLIGEILPVEQIVKGIITETVEIIRRLERFLRQRLD